MQDGGRASRPAHLYLFTSGEAVSNKLSYQRPRPPPPPPCPPRSRPPPDGRSVLGRASFTFNLRPPICDPLSAAMAFSPSSSFVISTNPKPRDRPVSRSVMMLTRSTCP